MQVLADAPFPLLDGFIPRNLVTRFIVDLAEGQAVITDGTVKAGPKCVLRLDVSSDVCQVCSVPLFVSDIRDLPTVEYQFADDFEMPRSRPATF